MSADNDLSPAGRIARAHDPDRFLIALFAPAARRETLFLLIAFNHELVRALEMPSQRSEAGPIAALIRLQWWREVVEGAARRHELAEPLRAALDSGELEADTLLGIIAAREAEAEGVGTLQEWRQVLLGGAGGMQVAAGQVLGVRDAAILERLRAIGAAYGAGALHRYQSAVLRAGRSTVPEAVLQQEGQQQEGREASAILLGCGQDWLRQADHPRLARAQAAALLPAVLARRDLAREPQETPRGLGDRLALISAWLRGAP